MATVGWDIKSEEMDLTTQCESQEPLRSSSLCNRRSHSRSQSWTTFPHTDFSSSITSVYSVSPLSSVIREFVPSLVNLTRPGTTSSNSNQNHIERHFSSNNLPQQLVQTNNSDDAQQAYDSVSPRETRITMEDLVSSSTSTHINTSRDNDTARSTLGVEISEGVRWAERNAVFFVILLLKFSVYHRYGLSLIIGMLVTFCHCNQVIRRQVALKTRRQLLILILTILLLAGSICFVYYVFWDKHIYNCLYFLPPRFTLDISNLLWSIWVTDYIVRFATMCLKALVATVFVRLIPNKRKRIIYMLLEYISQLYRSIIPAPLWVRYLSDKQTSGIVLAVLITATYLMIKGVVIFLSIRDLYRAVIGLIKYPLYERVHNNMDQLMETVNSTCPICQEHYHKPVFLKCKHVFCEDCMLQWLDRQNSCPLCRAVVPNHNPKWRDGSTSSWPQLF